jgi:hypothetical protein
VLLIRDVYPGMLIPDPGSKVFQPVSRIKKIPDPNPHKSASESGLVFLPIPDPGVKKAPDPGSRIRNSVIIYAENPQHSFIYS